MTDNMLVNGLIFGVVVLGGIWLLMLGIKNGHDAEIEAEKRAAEKKKADDEWNRICDEQAEKIRKRSEALSKEARKERRKGFKSSVSRPSRSSSSSSNSSSSYNDGGASFIAATSASTSSSSFTSCSPSSSSDGGCF